MIVVRMSNPKDSWHVKTRVSNFSKTHKSPQSFESSPAIPGPGICHYKAVIGDGSSVPVGELRIHQIRKKKPFELLGSLLTHIHGLVLIGPKRVFDSTPLKHALPTGAMLLDER